MKSFKKFSITSALLLGLSTAAYAEEKVVWWDFLGGGDGVRMKQ